jgi:hypothetical protein
MGIVFAALCLFLQPRQLAEIFIPTILQIHFPVLELDFLCQIE